MNIFEELMFKHQGLTTTMMTESLKRKSVKPEVKKINYKKLKVESFKIFEEEDLSQLDKEFAVDFEEKEDSDKDEVVLIIDPEIPYDEEVPEDAAQNLVGDLVYKCPVCGANYVCNCDAGQNESVEVDEEGIPVECPVCGDDADQILIGEIAPIEEVEETEEEEGEMEPVSVDDAEDNEDKVEEFEEEDEEVVEDSLKRRPLRRRIRTEAKESGICPVCGKEPCECDKKEEGCGSEKKVEESLGSDVGKYQKWVDYDMKHYGRISDRTNNFVKRAGLEIVKDDHGDYEVIAKEEEGCSSKKMTEDLDSEEIESTEEFVDDFELVDPVEEVKEEAPAVEVKAEKVEIVLDDVRFNDLMGQVIKENYKNSAEFSLTKVSSKGSQLTLEYVVHLGKKDLKGTFIAEGFDRESRTMKLRMKDKGVFTESFTKSPSFVVECVKLRNKVIPTKVRYNFTKKVNESLYRVRGTVDSQKK